MVASNLSMETAVELVCSSPYQSEVRERFTAFARLLQLETPREFNRFARACGVPFRWVQVPEAAVNDPTHPLHFLTKEPEQADEAA